MNQKKEDWGTNREDLEEDYVTEDPKEDPITEDLKEDPITGKPK